MNTDKSLNINAGDKTITLTLTRIEAAGKDCVQIDGRNYSIKFDNPSSTSFDQAIREILNQNFESIEMFEEKLSERVGKHSPEGSPKVVVAIAQSGIFPFRGIKPLSQTLSKEIVNDYLKKLEDCPFFSGVVKIRFSDGTTSQIIAKGSLPQQQFDEGTAFNIMSVGKLFTALSIMQLVEKGKVDPEAPITSYLDRKMLELSDEGTDLQYIKDMKFHDEETKKQFFDALEEGSITIRELLTHTSGIIEPPVTPYQYVPTEKGKYHYSNFGFQLLARVIAKASGQPFVNYVQNNVFKDQGNVEHVIMPGALFGSEHPPDSEPTPTRVYKGELLVLENPVAVPKPDGNGCWWMKTDDLIQFTQALQQGHYVSAQTLQTMLTPVVSRSNDGFLQQGLGFVVCPGKEGEASAFANQGVFEGRSALVCTIYDGISTIDIAALSNCDSGSNFFGDLVQMARGVHIETPLNYLEQEGEATKKAIAWLQNQTTPDPAKIKKKLVKSGIPSFLWELIAKDLDSTRPDLAKIIRGF